MSFSSGAAPPAVYTKQRLMRRETEARFEKPPLHFFQTRYILECASKAKKISHIFRILFPLFFRTEERRAGAGLFECSRSRQVRELFLRE